MRNTKLQRWVMPAALNLVATAVVLVAGSRAAFASTPLQSGTPPTVGDILIAPVSSTSVMVDAALDPNGLDTTYVVNFGTTAAYGLTTSPQNAGSGTAMLGSGGAPFWTAARDDLPRRPPGDERGRYLFER